MLEPRIYRIGFVAVMLAVMVFAFSLQNAPGARHTNLAPQFNGAGAFTTMQRLANQDPVRIAGSAQDAAVADAVTTALQSVGAKHAFTVSTEAFSGETAAGTRILQTVTGLEPGLSSSTIAVIAPRDGSGTASLSGTAVLMELAQVLGAQSLNHSILLASTSGTVGAAGTAQLAAQLTTDHVEAVIVLGDLAGRNASRPLIVPWSDSRLLAAPTLRATLASALQSQAGLRAGTPGVPAQLARLAFPLTIAAQGPLNAQGIPAVTLSVSGERGPTADEPTVPDPSRITGIGNAVLEDDRRARQRWRRPPSRAATSSSTARSSPSGRSGSWCWRCCCRCCW